MGRFERVIFRTGQASLLDVIVYGNEAIAMDERSIAFIRSGYFARPLNGERAIVDANYVAFGGDAGCLLAGGCEHLCACTILRCSAPSLAARASCAFVSSRAFLRQSLLSRHAPAHERAFEAAVADLLREMEHGIQVPLRGESRVVTAIRRLLNESPSRRVPLRAIASEFYMSPFTVSRMFHRETGMRLRDYSSRLRLRRALNLLLYTRKTITGIAIDLGFYDESHFSKAFHAEFGVSPHSVRKY